MLAHNWAVYVVSLRHEYTQTFCLPLCNTCVYNPAFYAAKSIDVIHTAGRVYKKVGNDAHARPCANSNPNHNPNLGRVHMPPLSIYTAGRVYSHCVQNQINVYPDLNNSNKSRLNLQVQLQEHSNKPFKVIHFTASKNVLNGNTQLLPTLSLNTSSLMTYFGFALNMEWWNFK